MKEKGTYVYSGGSRIAMTPAYLMDRFLLGYDIAAGIG